MTANLPKELLALRVKFTESLPERSRQVQELWSILRHQSWTDAGVHALEMLAHRLTGSCATFGYPKMSEASRELERFIQALREQGREFGGEEREQIQALVGQLVAALQQRDSQGEGGSWPIAEAPRTQSKTGTIFIVDDDQVLATLLASYLQRAGYACETFVSPSACLARLAAQPADLIIMDIGFPAAPLLGIEAIHGISEQTGGQTPIMLMSARTDLAARLQALRAGAANFIHKPVDFNELLKAVEQTMEKNSATLKVLVVDDDEAITAVMEKFLQAAGMQVKVVNQPMNTLQKAAQLRPDVILLDMHMPKVNGYELASLIRQDPEFGLTPIVFLTSDTSQNLKDSVRALGVSAYLNKPIDLNKLVEVIRYSHSNTRQLKRRIERVTKSEKPSLLTRCYFFDTLQRRLSAEPPERKMTLIYLGVDNLEKLQQHYGHIGMAQLQERFIDAITHCRGSGEQWTVIAELVAGALVNLDDEKALLNRADALLNYFKQHPLQVDGQPLSAKVSIGLLPLSLSAGSVNAAMAAAEKQYEAARKDAVNRVMLLREHADVDDIRFDPRHALPIDRFALAYQPIVDIETQASAHYDVLVRYRDPHDNLIPASRFIRLLAAEEKRVELDRWVFQSAVKALEADSNMREFATLFLHVAEDSLKQKTFTSFVSNVLRSSRIRGDKRLVIMLDVEWAALHAEQAAAIAKAFYDAHCGVCLTKVGLDSASLQMMTILKPQFVKLNADVSAQLTAKTLPLSALEPLTTSCRNSGCQLIATQVEDSATLSLLWQQGVRLFQGYFIQAPGNALGRLPVP